MNRIFIGIDPGLDGGIALNCYGNLTCTVVPTIKVGKGREIDVMAIQSMINRWPTERDDLTFIIEEASKHSPGKLALCSTWYTYGCLITLLKINKVKYETVRPLKWQKTFWTKPKMANGQKFDTKAAALLAAGRIWPDKTWLATGRCTKPHDGMIDAALISEYGRRVLS